MKKDFATITIEYRKLCEKQASLENELAVVILERKRKIIEMKEANQAELKAKE